MTATATFPRPKRSCFWIISDWVTSACSICNSSTNRLAVIVPLTSQVALRVLRVYPRVPLVNVHAPFLCVKLAALQKPRSVPVAHICVATVLLLLVHSSMTIFSRATGCLAIITSPQFLVVSLILEGESLYKHAIEEARFSPITRLVSSLCPIKCLSVHRILFGRSVCLSKKQCDAVSCLSRHSTRTTVCLRQQPLKMHWDGIIKA